jgi:uncharacterized membrane protein YhfC
MILLPIGLWIYFRRSFDLPWKLVMAGALTFIAAQVLHVPLVLGMTSFLQTLPLLANAIILGLLAGIFEETARYLLFKFILRNARSWQDGILVGLGHGGIESILLGILAAVSFATMVGYRNIDLSTAPSIPADQLELARGQVEAYWSAPWYMGLMGFVERVFTICLHVSLSVLVLYAVVYAKPVWFWFAVFWHALLDAVAVYVGQEVGILAVEGIIAVFAILSLWIVWVLRGTFLAQIETHTNQGVDSNP